MATPSARAFTRRQNGGARPVDDVSSPRIAHTLTACSRCRSRKTRCDPGLPRCGPCERTNSPCEYFDQARNKKMSRNYVVYLQHRVRDLEKQLAHLEKDDLYPDPEDLVRNGARVAIHDNDESKFLGPSSGIAITRLVMQLAKQFTGSASITEVIPENTAQDVKDQFERDDKKEYPLISAIAAERLPQRDLTNSLVRLFNLKVMAMYPFLHEPTFAQDVEDVYNGSTNAFQNFAVRMVIAVSLQRMDTQYAGLADSFYLAALQYFEEAVKPMNIKTIQCFALIAAYSLLTPTRTAVYYVIGLGVRLLQALGLCEEKTLSQSEDGRELNALEIDMNRRVFWSMINMDFALAHSLGRPSCFATLQEHIDVNWYHTVDDEYITPEGVRPGAPQSLKKWIGIHFHKMRLHQLEIRRKLYQKKRSEPVNDQDQWFKDMDAKIEAWKDATPEDVETGLDKAWFVGRYNTMVVFMYRPSPQVPRPSARAAARCYDAVKFNIYMHRAQIKARNVEMTWIFTQAIFMTINTILWSLSYAEIRAAHPREEVEGHLEVALECISQATERWPGVASAIQLYRTLVDAVIKIYDNEGDFPIEAGSPAESTGIDYPRSRTASPAAPSLPPHPSSDSAPNSAQGMRSDSPADESPFSYISPQPSFSFPARHSPLSSAKPNASNTASSPASSLSATPSAYNQRLSHSSTTSNNTVTTPYTPTPSINRLQVRFLLEPDLQPQ
ncbi:hypothetical protein EJ06DRAFT_224202 [Trichodelitschia bisporula]|uniref:Zn(2)-C6 fungal-type domain-containing protein n=1 Tax=Trichodelitschia bisporula TaxID=703511 RepID=A0A6G1HL23_9PEZI|nr:hypothetical protein EJ06DRAFT_224202 [Trichodelitschia bisporula]